MRDHVAYVHIKDGIWNEETQKPTYTWAGEGQGDVRRVVKDLLSRGYDGGISIEPHLATVFHDDQKEQKAAAMFSSYVEYGRRMERMIADIRRELQAGH